MIFKLLNVSILVGGLLTCIFLFVGYSSLLSFFPWGDDNAYVIWEPLLIYFIFPAFMIFGIVQPLAFKNHYRHRFIILFIGIMLLLPSWLGFDLATDKPGRWSGVVTAFISTLWIGANIFYMIGSRQNKEASTN